VVQEILPIGLVAEPCRWPLTSTQYTCTKKNFFREWITLIQLWRGCVQDDRCKVLTYIWDNYKRGNGIESSLLLACFMSCKILLARERNIQTTQT